jgi:hypothetical protein
MEDLDREYLAAKIYTSFTPSITFERYKEIKKLIEQYPSLTMTNDVYHLTNSEVTEFHGRRSGDLFLVAKQLRNDDEIYLLRCIAFYSNIVLHFIAFIPAIKLQASDE